MPPLRRRVHSAPPTLWWSWFTPQPAESISRSSTHFILPEMPPWYTGAARRMPSASMQAAMMSLTMSSVWTHRRLPVFRQW